MHLALGTTAILPVRSHILTITTISRDPPRLVALNHLEQLIVIQNLNRNRLRKAATQNSQVEIENLCYPWVMLSKQFYVNAGGLMKAQYA